VGANACLYKLSDGGAHIAHIAHTNANQNTYPFSLGGTQCSTNERTDFSPSYLGSGAPGVHLLARVII